MNLAFRQIKPNAKSRRTDSDYDTDAQAYFDVNTGMTTAQKDAYNDFVVETKGGSNPYAELIAFYPFIGSSESTCKWNALDPRDTDGAYRMEFYKGASSTITYDSNGVKLDGFNATGDHCVGFTNIFAVADFGKSQSAGSTMYGSVHFYSNLDISAETYGRHINAYWNGTTNESIQCGWDGHTDNQIWMRLGGTDSTDDGGTTGLGTWSYFKDSGGQKLYVNGAEVTSGTNTNLVVPTTDKGLAMGGVHNGTNPPTSIDHFFSDDPVTARYGCFAVGVEQMTTTQITELETAIDNLMVALGRSIYGVELADIANFSTTATGVSYSNGVITFDNVSRYDFSEELSLGTNGIKYRIAFEVFDYVKGELDIDYPFATSPNITANGEYVFIGTCGAFTMFRIMADGLSGTTLKIRNISMREVPI